MFGDGPVKGFIYKANEAGACITRHQFRTQALLRKVSKNLGPFVAIIFIAACATTAPPTPTLLPPPAPSPTPISLLDSLPTLSPTRMVITHQLEVKADPPEAADFLLNPKPLDQGGYVSGRTVTIDVMPKSGWKVEEWVGPVFEKSGRTAKMVMNSSQTVIVRLVQLEVPTATPTSTPAATPTLVPTHMPTPTPTNTLTPTPTTPPPTVTPPPTPTPTPTPILTPTYRLNINGNFVASGQAALSLPFGSMVLSKPGDYPKGTMVTMTVYLNVPGTQVVWNGVDTHGGNLATVSMAGDRFVTVNVIAPTPTPTPPTLTPPTATPTPTPAPPTLIPPTSPPTPTPTSVPAPPTPTPTPLIPHLYGNPVVGITAEDVTPEVVAREGLLVTRGQFVTADPYPRSAGAAIGLKRADVITLLNNRDVGTKVLWSSVFSQLQAGENVLVTFVRGSTKFEREVSLGAYYYTGNIAAGTAHRLNYFLEPGQTLEFYFTENGGIDVGFSIIDPDGEPVIASTRKVSFDGEVNVKKLGAYQVVFDNGFSFFAGKGIHWYYRITR